MRASDVPEYLASPRICIGCREFNTGSLPAVDQAGGSSDEADGLCLGHRARMTEGYCVLCGRRKPWMSPFPKSDIGCCQLCYMMTFGIEAAEALEASWRDQAA